MVNPLRLFKYTEVCVDMIGRSRYDYSDEVKSIDDYQRDARIWNIERKVLKILLLAAVITIIIVY